MHYSKLNFLQILIQNKKIRPTIVYIQAILIACLIFSTQQTFALITQELEALKKEHVLDLTSTLNAEEITQLKEKNEILYHDKDVDLKILIISQLSSFTLEEYGTYIFNEIKIGNKEKNNGLLLLIVKDQRLIRFETGYGLEHILPDIKLGQIIRHDIAPNFQKNLYYEGIDQSIEKINALVPPPAKSEEVITDHQNIISKNKIEKDNFSILELIGLFFIFSLFSFFIFAPPLLLLIYLIKRSNKHKPPEIIIRTDQKNFQATRGHHMFDSSEFKDDGYQSNQSDNNSWSTSSSSSSTSSNTSSSSSSSSRDSGGRSGGGGASGSW